MEGSQQVNLLKKLKGDLIGELYHSLSYSLIEIMMKEPHCQVYFLISSWLNLVNFLEGFSSGVYVPWFLFSKLVASDFLVDLKYLGHLGFWHLALEPELSNIKVIYTTFRSYQRFLVRGLKFSSYCNARWV